MNEKDLVILRNRFCRDYNVSIQIFTDPYFTDRIKLFGFYDKYLELLDIVKNDFNDNVELYLAYYNKVKDDIIYYIKNSTAFIELNTKDRSKYFVKSKYPSEDIYKEDCIGHRYISIDWKKANFSVLVKYAETTNTEFYDSYNWVSFMKQFTKYNYIIDSKYIRQVVFGNCNPKCQIELEKYYMYCFTKDLLDSVAILKENDIVSMREDELIISADNLSETDIAYIKDISKTLQSKYLPLDFKYFILGKLENTEGYYKSILDNGVEVKYELKCVNPYEAPFIYRFIKGGVVQETDLYFYSKPYIAKFVTYPKDIRLNLGE